jgi:uncharacterized LabA/DUF88 family protein
VLEDIMEGNCDRCVFVGGDEDYTPMLEAVRRRGVEVWLVAFDRWVEGNKAFRDPNERTRSSVPPSTAARCTRA